MKVMCHFCCNGDREDGGCDHPFRRLDRNFPCLLCEGRGWLDPAGARIAIDRMRDSHPYYTAKYPGHFAEMEAELSRATETTP